MNILWVTARGRQNTHRNQPADSSTQNRTQTTDTGTTKSNVGYGISNELMAVLYA